VTAPIRWGILGAGGIAAKVGDDIAAVEGNVLHAVAARDEARAARFAQEHGVERVHRDYRALVEDDDLDVVYIATTHAQHHEQALLALRAGRPILVEKAFTLTAKQAADVVAEARAQQLFCMEAMWMRMHPLVRDAVRRVKAGDIGDVLAVHAELSRYFEYDPAHRLFDLAAGGGALLDLGVYPATFAWLILGLPDTIQATATLAPTGADMTTALQWGYAAGPVAQIFSSAAATTPAAGLITGTDGWIRIEGRIHHPSAITVHTSSGEQVVTAGRPRGNGYQLQAAEVARCLRAGLLESPLVPLDETVGILAVLDESRRQLGVRYAADED
jgi:predicted dehydrogenase